MYNNKDKKSSDGKPLTGNRRLTEIATNYRIIIALQLDKLQIISIIQEKL